MKCSKPPPLPATKGCRAKLTAPRTLAATALLIVLTGAVWIFMGDPHSEPGLLLPCAWHSLTGLNCPGCGMTRAIYDLMHGQLAEGVGHNAFGLLVLLTTLIVLTRPVFIALIYNRWQAPLLPSWTARALIISGLLWALLRNLPWPPFTSLAP